MSSSNFTFQVLSYREVSGPSILGSQRVSPVHVLDARVLRTEGERSTLSAGYMHAAGSTANTPCRRCELQKTQRDRAGASALQDRDGAGDGFDVIIHFTAHE